MKKISEFDFYPCLSAQHGLVLLLFTAPGCSACRAVKGLLRDYEMLRDDLHVWEADAVENSGLLREFEVFHLPAMFLFREGEYLRPLHFEMNPSALHGAVEAACMLPALDAP